ncbi:hypothetical protein PI95_034280 [Hassallia byssoidea VB512170]|uniref:Uncharacterized protein n=1 Tax=Hassallia byssoidea VB512170 TaxID=1304833 RepID=A0A846HJ64_9CYAN|nr:hypothetical protein [Hassalia byssoidea]NEU77402.1 hypothetical protein [Hassalia byssoidea VB512170]
MPEGEGSDYWQIAAVHINGVAFCPCNKEIRLMWTGKGSVDRQPPTTFELRLPVHISQKKDSPSAIAGEISSRVQLNDKVAEVLSGRLATTVIDAVMMVLYFLIMIQYDRLLSAIAQCYQIRSRRIILTEG